jgi:thiol:disulfide interchange protein DsbD
MTTVRIAAAALMLVTTAAGVAGCGSQGVAAQQAVRPTAVLTPLAEHDAARSGREVRLALRVVLPSADLHVQANKPREAGLIPTVLTIDAPAGVTIEELVYPESTEFSVAGFDRPLLVYGHDFVIGVRARVAASVPLGTVTVPARVRYQACDNLLCYVPLTVETRWAVPVVAADATVTPQHQDVFRAIKFGSGSAPPARTEAAPAPVVAQAGAGVAEGLAAMDGFDLKSPAGTYMNRDEFLEFIANAEAGITPSGWFEGRGPFAILAIVLIGGLALNLTPCVLPMIPINLAIIGAGARAGSRQRGFLLGASYGAAMTVVYGAIGLVVILTAGAFGGINASPWFNLAIAVVFVVLGLAMFDVFQIDFTKYSTAFQFKGSQQGSVPLAFAMGAVAALLAGACVAPVVIQVVLFASDLYAGGSRIALALPFVLGLGMAIPWPIAGAGMAALPKPGAWMVRVKQVFGVLILATAAYYGYLAYTLFENRRVDATEVASSVESMIASGWHSSLAAGLDEAQRDQKPVLLDLWATWCKNCLVMDQTTLKDPAVTAALEGYVKIKVQSEDLDDPATSALMQRIRAVGLPAYVVLQPRQ